MKDAVERGDIEELKRLLAEGMDPTAEDNWAIRMAAEKGHTEIVELLLKDPRVDPSAENNDAIGMAAENGHTEIVKCLLKDQRVDPSAVGNWAIRMAAEKGHTEIVERLLQDRRVDPSTKDNRAILRAAGNGHTEIVKHLLQDPRVDPSAVDNWAIGMAAGNGHTEIVERLLQDPRVDPSTGGNVAIRRAAGNGHTEIVKCLLQDRRVDPSTKDNRAILRAAEKGHTEIVALLEEHTCVQLYSAVASQNYAVLPPLLDHPNVPVSALRQSLQVLAEAPQASEETVALFLQDGRITDSLMPCVQVLPDAKTEASSQIEDKIKRQYGVELPAAQEERTLVLRILGETAEFLSAQGLSTEASNGILQRTMSELFKKTTEDLEILRTKTKKRSIDTVSDFLSDYAQSLLLPRVVQYATTHREKNADAALLYQRLESNPTCLNKALCRVVLEHLCKDLSITEILTLSDYWHTPQQQAVLLKPKDYGGKTWNSLFETKEDKVKNISRTSLSVPEEMLPGGWTVVALTTPQQLKEEGTKQEHCVGGYSGKCLTGNTHIISVRNPQGEPVSTIEYEVNSHNQQIKRIQHFGKKNAPPIEKAETVESWLQEALQNGKIPVDYSHLDTCRNDRMKEAKTLRHKVTLAIGFDPLDEKAEERVKDVYRSHTPEAAQFTALMTVPSFTIPTREGEKEVVLNPHIYAQQKSKKKSAQASLIAPVQDNPIQTATIQTALQERMDQLLEKGKVTVEVTRHAAILLTPKEGVSKKAVQDTLAVPTKTEDKAKYLEIEDTNQFKIVGMSSKALLQALGGKEPVQESVAHL